MIQLAEPHSQFSDLSGDDQFAAAWWLASWWGNHMTGEYNQVENFNKGLQTTILVMMYRMQVCKIKTEYPADMPVLLEALCSATGLHSKDIPWKTTMLIMDDHVEIGQDIGPCKIYSWDTLVNMQHEEDEKESTDGGI